MEDAAAPMWTRNPRPAQKRPRDWEIVGLTTYPESVIPAEPSCPYRLDSFICPFATPLLFLGLNSIRYTVLLYEISVKWNLSSTASKWLNSRH